MIVVYGLKSCDSCRKAVKLLQAGGQSYRFHDLRDDGLPEGRLAQWLERLGWERLLNRRSTTWRELRETEKSNLDAPGAARLLAENPTLIKRPVVEAGERLLVGFAPAEQAILTGLSG
ncbi:MAG: arsenate reductase [Kiloniellaceae bacterium]